MGRHFAYVRSDRHWAFRAALVTSAIERQRGLRRAQQRYLSPCAVRLAWRVTFTELYKEH